MTITRTPALSRASNLSAPTALSGCVLWLDAGQVAGVSVDGTAVSSWTDRSGSANHATTAGAGTAPTFKTGILAGKPVVRFNGTTDALQLTSRLSFTDFTVYTVHKWATTGTVLGSTNDANAFFYRLFTSAPTGDWLQAGALGFITNSVPPSAFNVAGWFRQSGAISFYRNSVPQTLTSNQADVTSCGFNYLGALFSGGLTQWFNGDLAEVIAINRALSNTERQSLEWYLNLKYGLGSSNAITRAAA